MIWAVLDTNTLVSGLLFGGNPERVVDCALTGRFMMVTSPALLSEFERVLRYEKLARYVDDPAALVLLVESSSVIVEPTKSVAVVGRDEADNRVLEAAQAGHADFVVTGDDDLLAIGSFDGTEIVDSTNFLNAIGTAE